ncbi:hypothetical protein [Bradyrhizobium sp. BR 10261]|nr:hypothetical protein [Bradyrhizobium sp. BR 10261]
MPHAGLPCAAGRSNARKTSVLGHFGREFAAFARHVATLQQIIAGEAR